MAEIDLPSSGDETDEDFVPEGEPSSDEGSSSAHSGDISDEEKGPKSRKRRKLSKKKSTKVEEKAATGEDEKKVDKVPDIDALWADFKEDVNKMEKRIVSRQARVDEKPKLESPKEKPAEIKKEPAESKEEPGNAGSGEKKNLPTTMKRGTKLGLNKVLEQLAKKEKMSTLTKSKFDWLKFKKTEGIEEDLKKHNKGKDGYLEKQDFLQRTDLRQFEIEKQLRASKRNQKP